MDFKTKDEAYEFLVKVGAIRPHERTLEGQEKEEMMLVLKLLSPAHSTNNQRFINEHYHYGDFEYSVTYFNGNDYEIIEITP
jgi:hypothetical protein